MQQQYLVAGDTLSFVTAVSAYTASAGWVLKFRLVPRAAGSAIVITSTAEGDNHRTAVAAGTSAVWAPGEYGWSSWVEKAGETYTIDSGQIAIRANPRTVAAGTDSRSMARKALDDAKVALAAWTPTRRRYRIGDREMEFNSTAEIVRLISYWQIELRREEQAERLAKGLPDRRKAYVRFGRA